MGRKKLLPPAKQETAQALTAPGLLTVAEVADIFRVDPTTVRRWVRQGALEAIILPNRGARQAYRIRQETIENHLTVPTPEQNVPVSA